MATNEAMPELATQALARPADAGLDRAAARLTPDHLALVSDPIKRDVWISQLVEIELARQNYQADRALAKEFALCGKFDDIKGGTPEQNIATAMVKIQLGRGWGFGAADSIKYVYFVNGKPALETAIISAKLQQHGYDWDLEWIEDQVDHKGRKYAKCVGCRLWVKQLNRQTKQYEPLLDREGKPVKVEFTEFDADNAKVYVYDKAAGKSIETTLSEKQTYKSWGRDMYFWRAISRVQKYHAPHVLRGVIEREEALEIMPVESEKGGEGFTADPPSLRDRILASAEAASEAEEPKTGK